MTLLVALLWPFQFLLFSYHFLIVSHNLQTSMQSLWHLRRFSDQYRNIVRGIPHFGVSGNRCVICLLHQMFSAWESKDDRRATIILKYMRTAFIKILNDTNISQKVCCFYFYCLLVWLVNGGPVVSWKEQINIFSNVSSLHVAHRKG